MWLKNTILLFLLLLLSRTGQGNQGCGGRPNDSCPYQDVYTRTRDITEIPKSVASIITEMFFVQTSLVEIREGAFQNMPNLVKIEFMNNKIKKVEAGAFDNLEKLEDLEITGAELGDLPVGTFRSLSHLRKVNLRDSHIRRIEKGLFDNLGNLEEIYLHMNEIPFLPNGIFDGLPKLTLLHLAMNQISNISQDIFRQLTQLRILRLQKNQITSLAEGSLDSLQDLVELNLENNRIQTLSPTLLRQLTSLEKLFLDNNLLEVLPDELFFGLRKIKQLKIASNLLKAVPALGVMPVLKELDLSRNSLLSLGNLASASLPSLTTLKLQRNLLESIPTGQFDHLGKLTSLYLGDNPWRCDCHLFYLHQWISNNAKRIKDARKVICRSPGNVAGTEVSLLTKDQLVCLTTTPILVTFRTTPLPVPASPSATSARRSTAGAPVRSTTLHGTTTSETSATAPETSPATSRQIVMTGRLLPETPPTQTLASSPPSAPTQSSTFTKTSPEITSPQAATPTSGPTTTTDATTVTEVPSMVQEITPPQSHQSTPCTDTLTTDCTLGTRSKEATTAWGFSTTISLTTPTRISSATLSEQFTAPKTSTEIQDPPTSGPVITPSYMTTSMSHVSSVKNPWLRVSSTKMFSSWQTSTPTSTGTGPYRSVCSSRPSAPETPIRQAATVPGTPIPTARLAQTPAAGPAPVLSSAADRTCCSSSSSSSRPSPPSAGSPLSPHLSSFLPLFQVWGFSLSSNYQYCQVFLLLYLSMLCVDVLCAVVLGRLAYVLCKATESVELPSRPVRLVHIKARKGGL